MHSLFVRTTALAMLAGGLLIPASAFAAPGSDSGTGTVVGVVTCGPDEDAPAAHIVVSAAGAHLQTLTDSTGRFFLSGLPAGQTFAIDAVPDPQASMVVSRYNVTVQSGETLDIGSLDLGICGTPSQPAPVTDDQPADFSQGV
jgi:hypothetical protein